jgi:hypothetical protein
MVILKAETKQEARAAYNTAISLKAVSEVEVTLFIGSESWLKDLSVFNEVGVLSNYREEGLELKAGILILKDIKSLLETLKKSGKTILGNGFIYWAGDEESKTKKYTFEGDVILFKYSDIKDYFLLLTDKTYPPFFRYYDTKIAAMGGYKYYTL